MRKIIYLLPFLFFLNSCDQVDCTLDNSVSYTCNFYAEGTKVTLNDVVTVTALGTDSVLINQMQGIAGKSLPMSYWNAADTLVMHIKGNGYELADTIWVTKENLPHFESPDCPTKMFHRITNVNSTHTFIDSLSLVNPNVNYADIENIQIHLFAAE